MDQSVTDAVKDRYAAGAGAREASLCCAIDYDPALLEVIPAEVIDRDYGCGDPSRYVRAGDTVLDLGSGGGKVCFIASQIVGSEGRVIGIDMTDEMLALARSAAPRVAEAVGYANVTFRKGRIEDLATDYDELAKVIQENPVTDLESYEKIETAKERMRRETPLVADSSIDIIVSNCVLNLVRDSAKPALFREMLRVLKPGGRIAISDIVSDRPSPAHLKSDPTLWSGCISGALEEQQFLEELAAVGFRSIMIDKRDEQPWQVIEGIEYRSVTVLATKPAVLDESLGECQVIYRGPWKWVEDDDGRRFERGARQPVDAEARAALAGDQFARELIAVNGQAQPCCAAKQTPSSCC